jgi:hypothetical protein
MRFPSIDMAGASCPMEAAPGRNEASPFPARSIHGATGATTGRLTGFRPMGACRGIGARVRRRSSSLLGRGTLDLARLRRDGVHQPAGIVAQPASRRAHHRTLGAPHSGSGRDVAASSHLEPGPVHDRRASPGACQAVDSAACGDQSTGLDPRRECDSHPRCRSGRQPPPSSTQRHPDRQPASQRLRGAHADSTSHSQPHWQPESYAARQANAQRDPERFGQPHAKRGGQRKRPPGNRERLGSGPDRDLRPDPMSIRVSGLPRALPLRSAS